MYHQENFSKKINVSNLEYKWWLILTTCIASSFYILEAITLTKIGFGIFLIGFPLFTPIRNFLNFQKLSIAETYLYIFFIFSGITVIWSSNSAVSISHYISLASCIALYTLVRISIKSVYFRIEIIFKSLIFATLISCIFGIAQFFTGRFFVPGIDARSISTGDTFRANGLFDDPNYFGYLLTLVWPIVIVLFKKNQAKRNILLFIFLFSALTTFSRATLLITLFQFIVIGLFTSKNLFIFLRKVAFISPTILAFLFVVNPFGILDRITSFLPIFLEGSGDIENSTAERFDLMLAGGKMFYDNFWLGVGFGSFQLHSTDYMSFFPREVYAHNTYLTIAAESGILGIGLYSLCIISIIINLHKLKSQWLLISFIGFILSNFFLVAHYFPITYIYLSALIGYIGFRKLIDKNILYT